MAHITRMINYYGILEDKVQGAHSHGTTSKVAISKQTTQRNSCTSKSAVHNLIATCFAGHNNAATE